MLIVLTLALLLETFSLAWVSDNGLSSIINVSGSVHKNYFEYGEGTKEKPYGIANPVQLYYFSIIPTMTATVILTPSISSWLTTLKMASSI